MHGNHSFEYEDGARPEMLKYVPLDARRVLEVGCHTGHFGLSIKNKCGAEVWGVEPNAKAASIASGRLDKVFVDFFQDDLDLPNDYFDVITFTDVLEHMPDPSIALRLAEKKLSLTGIIIVSVPNLRHIDNLVHILKERDFKYEDSGVRDRTHLRFFTLKSAPRLFNDTGLQMISIGGINEHWYTKSILRRLSYRMFPKYLNDTKHAQFAMVAMKL